MRSPSMRTLRSRLCSPRTTTSLAMPPLRSFQTPASSASSSPTSRAGLSRTSVASTLSRGTAADTVTTSRTPIGSSTSAIRASSPAAIAMSPTSRGARPGKSARSVYVPGATRSNTNAPALSEVPRTSRADAPSTSVSVACGSRAPSAVATVPVSVPVTGWPSAGVDRAHAQTIDRIPRRASRVITHLPRGRAPRQPPIAGATPCRTRLRRSRRRHA